MNRQQYEFAVAAALISGGLGRSTESYRGSVGRIVGRDAGGRVVKQPGRNDRCPCGSGKKYKKCCG